MAEDRLTAEGVLIVQCKTCRHEFSIGTDEQSFYRRRGLNLPKRCPVCRRLGKAKRNNGRKPVQDIETFLNDDLETD